MEAPFQTYQDSLLRRYGSKTYKVTVSGGRTCPTRDGTFGPGKGWGGCSFCDVHGSASYFSNMRKELTVKEQLDAAVPPIRARFKAEKFIAYFQSYTTTHQEIEEFRKRYDEAVAYENIVRLAVGTRPDCLPDEVLDVLTSYLDRVDVQLELGVQSLDDETLLWFDRGHDRACAIEGLERSVARARECTARGSKHYLDVSAHLILGTPLDTPEKLKDMALTLNRIGVDGVKVHHLHVMKKTKLERRYEKEGIPFLTMPEYFEIAGTFLRYLDPKTVIHRVHGHAPHPEELVGPHWTAWKVHPADEFKKYMTAKGWKQGDLL